MAQSQQSLDDMKKRIAVIQEKHDAVTIERGQVALEFAVSYSILFESDLSDAFCSELGRRVTWVPR